MTYYIHIHIQIFKYSYYYVTFKYKDSNLKCLYFRQMLVSLMVFCICSPLGIAVAMGILDLLMSTGASTMNLVSGMLQMLRHPLQSYLYVAQLAKEIKS